MKSKNTLFQVYNYILHLIYIKDTIKINKQENLILLSFIYM